MGNRFFQFGQIPRGKSFCDCMVPGGKNLSSSIPLQTFYAVAQMLMGIISETRRFAERFRLKSIKQIQDSVTRSPGV